MTNLTLLLLASAPAFATCTPVTGTRILGSDLARADARFSALPSGYAAAFAPSPGAKRVVTTSELDRLARANGMQFESAADICFEFPVHPLDKTAVLTAMRRSLPSGASLEILDLSKTDVPAGEIQFPIDTLEKQMWRGFVTYSENRRMPIWADVALSITRTSVVAAVDLPQDVPIDAASLRTVTTTTSTPSRTKVLGIDEIERLAPKVPLKAGSVIRPSDLVAPSAIRRGDTIRVEVQSGPARLHFDAVAETSARAGEIVELRNPLNGKTFKARIYSPSKAVVVIGGKQTQ